MLVSFTQAHGTAQEVAQFPPPGVIYSFLEHKPQLFRIIHSPVKGFMRKYYENKSDFIEAVISPIQTEKPWSLWVANFQEAMAFNLLGCPIPRAVRVSFVSQLLRRENFKRLIFFSRAGRDTLATYGGVHDQRILEKVSVVYPAIREVPDGMTRKERRQGVNLLFSGDFFRKGGVHVVDAFERLQKDRPSINLRLCCDEHIDFNTPNLDLKHHYLTRIKSNPSIQLGRMPREQLIGEILPIVDIFLMPSYVEAFGYAILEAMAFGIPVISTTCFAIPEMVEHGRTGLLADTAAYDCDRLFKGYVVNKIPKEFSDYMTESIYDYLKLLVFDADLRKLLGSNGREIARTRFSVENRNEIMLKIYQEALSG